MVKESSGVLCVCKQKTAYEMRISDWSSDVCSSDLDHGGCRRLAMRSGYRDSGFEPHQFRQHFRAPNNGDTLFQRQIDFRVAAPDRGGGHDNGGIAQIFRLMTDHHVDALVTQPLHHIAFGNVCALNLVAQIMHHLRNAGHANAANANEVRSEEHTSELQSLMRISYAVFCLKKKKKSQQTVHLLNNQL